jgi:hypothetical protein
VQKAAVYDSAGSPQVRVSGRKSQELKFTAGIRVAADADAPAGAILRR